MICYKCNAEIPDDSKICPMCGVPVEYPKDAEPAVDFSEVPAPKKGLPGFAKKILFVGLPIVAVVVAVVLLITSNWRAIKGFAIKTFGDDNDYLRYVEAEQFGDYADTVTTLYGRFMDTFEDRDDLSLKGNIEVQVSDKAMDLISDFVPSEALSYFDWFEKANISYTTNIKDNQYKVELGVGLNGKDVISGNVIMDEDGNAYLQVPELNKQYIYAEGEEMGAAAVTGSMDKINETDFGKYLPDANEVNRLLKKYIKLVTETIDDVESDKVSLEVAGIENDYTALTITIDEELMYKMALAALENLEDDKDIETMIGDIVDLMDELGLGKADADDVFDQLVEFSEQGADVINEMIDSLEGDGEVYCVLVDYVDGGSNIIGRAIQMPQGENGELVTVFEYYEVTRGGKYGMYLVSGAEGDRQVVMEGTGKKGGNKITINEGAVTMKYEDETLELITFTTKNLNEDDLADGFFNGTATIGLGDDFTKLYLNADSSDIPASVLALLDLKVQITGKGNNAKNADMTLALLLDDDVLVSLHVTGKQAGGSAVKLPNEDDCAWATDGNDMEDWLGDIDTDKVIENLEKAGVPDDIIDAFESIVDGGFVFGGAQKVPAVNAPNYGDVIYGGY